MLFIEINNSSETEAEWPLMNICVCFNMASLNFNKNKILSPAHIFLEKNYI